jgi:type I restriction enzyme S subunit
MSKIDELIQELCPDGVEYKELGSVLNYEQPTKYIVKSSKYNDEFSIPVLTAGQTFILGYTDENFGIYNASSGKPVIIFDDFTTSFHWVDFNFKVKSSAMKMLTKCNDEIDFRFAYYAMRCILYSPQDHARQWISVYSKFQIPIPPLPIQQEIVRILDNFTKLEAELEAELEARKKQYEYYRNQLLTTIEKDGKWYMSGNEVGWKTLGEVCVSLRKGTLKRGQLVEDGAYPVINSGREWYGFYESYNNEADALIIAARGEYAGFVSYISTKFWAGGLCYPYRSIKDDVIQTKFIYYYLKNNEQSIMDVLVSRGSIPAINKSDVDRIQIPIPPLSEQERIVSILDRFDALVNDISIGLPAEIEARRKQYEYYRGKLLSFKNIADRAEA